MPERRNLAYAVPPGTRGNIYEVVWRTQDGGSLALPVIAMSVCHATSLANRYLRAYRIQGTLYIKSVTRMENPEE